MSKLRDLVRLRADNCCEYCRLSQAMASFVQFQLEHIRAKQHGGDDSPENLAWACPRCNRHKGPNLTAIDPITNTVSMLFNPRTQDWDEHFIQVGVEIVGITALGRSTVHLLKMNDEDRLRVRQAMIDS